jgi:hypothetical protein
MAKGTDVQKEVKEIEESQKYYLTDSMVSNPNGYSYLENGVAKFIVQPAEYGIKVNVVTGTNEYGLKKKAKVAKLENDEIVGESDYFEDLEPKDVYMLANARVIKLDKSQEAIYLKFLKENT